MSNFDPFKVEELPLAVKTDQPTEKFHHEFGPLIRFGDSQTDASIEAEIQAKGLTAPRVTPADIEANIVAEYWFTADKAMGEGVPLMPALSMLTFCVLVLRNGHTVTGESHCADPAKFNAETGRVEARKRAIDELWPMVIYAERERLSQA